MIKLVVQALKKPAIPATGMGKMGGCVYGFGDRWDETYY